MDLTRLRIIYYPDPRLRKRSTPVETIDQDLADLTRRMFELMYEVRGLGLAAVQAGVNRRLFITNHVGQPDGERVYVNPEIIEMEGVVELDEGCLSVPELFVPTKRALKCKLRAVGLDGQPFEEEATELLARAWQHEMDHLNGVLICDRMTPASRIANRRLLKDLERKYKRSQAAGGRVGVT